MKSLKGSRVSGTPSRVCSHAASGRPHAARSARKPVAFAQLSAVSPNQTRAQPLQAAEMDTSSTAHAPAPQRVFMFNPNDPNSVEEMMITPHEDIDAAEELLTIAHGEAKAAEAAAGGPAPGRQPVQRTPIPLRAVSPMPTRGRSRPNMAARLPGAPFMAQPSQALVQSSSRDTSINNTKNQEMTKQLVAQLQKEQGHVANLQQYEVMYREWRMKAERLDSDIGTLQRLVAEKDGELAHGYKLLEASAAERSRLRHSYQASSEKARQLQLQLAEAQARAIAGTPAPPLIGDGHSNGHSNGNGRGRGNGNTLALGGVQGLIEELSTMAKGIATEMQQEVTTMKVASPVAGSSGRVMEATQPRKG